jgi:hypothetical protein
MRLKLVWYALVVTTFVASFFFNFSWPTNWAAAMSALAPVEAWWGAHAAHPTLAAFIAGLAVGTVLLPELWFRVSPYFLPLKLKADIGGADAIKKILTGSKWAKNLVTKGLLKTELRYESHLTAVGITEGRLVVRLIKELHDLLRAGDLTAWGTPDNRKPYQEIKPDEWSDLEIDLSDVNRDQGPAVHAVMRRNQSSGMKYGYVWIKFCRKQIEREFPSAYWPRKISDTPNEKAKLSEAGGSTTGEVDGATRISLLKLRYFSDARALEIYINFSYFRY